MRILEANHSRDLKKIMQDIRVDKYGIEIMWPKALRYLIRINNLSNITANILKQEMLSLGADAAVARDALTGRRKKTDCLLMGNLAQLRRLDTKLRKQPFGLDRLYEELNTTLENYQRDDFTLDLGRYRLKIGKRKLIMGIVNLTPDSFSADGLYKVSGFKSQVLGIIDFVERMVRDGANIIDIGGESSRPGARAVSVKEELARTIPVIKRLARKIKVPISIDTYKPEVAKAALDCGAAIVNDITGLRNIKMAKVVSRYKSGIVIMHMRGAPRNMQKNPVYQSLIDEIIAYLDKAIKTALDLGISREKMIVDPGIGFGKTRLHNLEILKRLKEFKVLGLPILVGPSRKSFLGKILHEPAERRISGTLAACIWAGANGADILRVHDVKAVKQSLKVLDAINKIS